MSYDRNVRVGYVLGALCGMGTTLWGHDAAAAAIYVNFSSSTTTAPYLDDGKCDIVEAVEAANSDNQVHTGDCPAGSGADEIILTAGAVYRVKFALRLTSAISMYTNGSTPATIKPAATWNFANSNPGDESVIFADNVAALGGANGNPIKLTDIKLIGNGNFGVTGFGSENTFADLTRVTVSGFKNGGIRSYCPYEGPCDNGSKLNLRLSNITGNNSPANGAGIDSFGVGSSVLIENSSITGNASDGSGGGIYLGGAPNIPNILNSTISGNWAYFGGGIAVDFVSGQNANTYLQIFSSTIAYNEAVWSGGGLHFQNHSAQGDSHDIKLYSSIIANNIASDAAHPNIFDSAEPDAGFTSIQCLRNSLVYVPSGSLPPLQLESTLADQCVFNVADAKLAPLMDMGGNGLPVHALLSNSPAIDAVVTSNLILQQRDVVTDSGVMPPAWQLWDRNYDGNSDGVNRRDAGSFEYERRWQTELLKVQAQGSATLSTVTTPGTWDRGAGQNYAATSATSQFVTYVVPIAEARSYNISIGVMRHKAAGMFQVAVATSPSGPWTPVGGVQDAYLNTTTLTPTLLNLTSGQSLSVAQTYFRVTVTGKNASSTNYNLNIDYIRIAP